MSEKLAEVLSKEQVAEMMADETGLYSWEHIQRLCRSHEYLRARLEMKQHEVNRLAHRASAQRLAHEKYGVEHQKDLVPKKLEVVK